MDYRVLGPLEVQESDQLLPLRGAKQRAVLALLLLSANRVVGRQRLIDDLWGDQPPETAVATLQVYISRLRKLLPYGVLLTRPPGYLLAVEPDALDLLRFESLVAEARKADPEEASELLRAALGLWRGPALAEFASEPFGETEAARLDDLRLGALEQRIDLDLAGGRHSDVIGELEAAIADYPYRERLHCQLILAFYRSARQADALAAFRRARDTLDELGIEPGIELRELEKAVLVQDPALRARSPLAEEPPPLPEPSAPAAPPPAATRAPVEVRKTVTVLLCDIADDGEADPEALRGLLTRCLELATTVVERHGGTIEQLVGGGMMAVFGVPAVHEDDALRAVHTAIEIRDTVPDLGVRARIGIDTGEIVTGGNASITGSVVAAGRRLGAAAAGGEILIGLRTATLVAGAAMLEHAGPIAAKGKTESVDTWRLLGVDPGAPGVRRRFGGVLVGRDEPLRLLVGALERAATELTCLPVLVVGPPGIGKSRLAHEFFSAREVRARVLRGRCIPFGRGVTFWALGEIVREAGGVAALPLASDDAALVRERLSVAIGDSFASVPGDEIFWAVRRAVEALAREGPLIVCIDDLHLAEPMLLDLVEYLAGWCRDAPVLLLGLARPDLLETRGAPPGALMIELEPLAVADCAAMLDELDVREASLRERIVSTADGNPLFVEQLAAMVHERGDAEEPTVPASITAVLEARLDGLPADERAVLERAAVVGKEFWLDAIVHLAPPEQRFRVASALLALARKGFVEPAPGHSLPYEDVSRFSHILIRDAAYAGLPKSERAELHERFADRIGEGTGAAIVPNEIAGYHLEHAWAYRRELGLDDERTSRLGESAGRRLGAAARGALGREDEQGACLLLERAVPLLRSGDSERLALEVEWAQSMRELGETDRAEEIARSLLAEATCASDDAAVAHARLALHWGLFEDDVAAHRQVVVEVIDVFEQARDSRGLARAWRRLSWLEERDGAHAASEQAAREAMRHAIACGDLREEARAVDALCTSLLYGPTPVPVALAECRALLARGRQSPTLEANVLAAVAGLEGMQMRFAEALATYDRAERLFNDLGLRLALSGLTQVGVPLALLAGDLEAAEREARLGLEILAGVGAAAIQVPLLAEVLLAAGRLDEAREALSNVDPERTPKHLPWQVKWRCTRARLLAHEGADGTALAREALALADETDDPNLAGEALSTLAVVLDAAGEREESAQATRLAREAFERKGNGAAAEALGPALAC